MSDQPTAVHTILGANGAIGRELSPLLRTAGVRVRQVARRPRAEDPADEIVAADLLDAAATAAAVAGSEVAYLLAGLRYDPRVWAAEWPVLMRNAIDACRRHGCRLVFFDNVYVYGRVDGAMTENTPYNPCSRKGEVRARLATTLMDAVRRGELTAMIVRAAVRSHRVRDCGTAVSTAACAALAAEGDGGSTAGGPSASCRARRRRIARGSGRRWRVDRPTPGRPLRMAGAGRIMAGVGSAMMAGPMTIRRSSISIAVTVACLLSACAGQSAPVLTISGSVLGREGDVLRMQLDRFRARHPELSVEVRVTPDAADLRHQLYVQWLNAHVSEPDVLQLDVVWTAEFAAAGWILPLEVPASEAAGFFPAAVDAHRWRDRIYALPWFVDVGMLYWRSDLLSAAPADLDALDRMALAVLREPRGAAPAPAFGYVWQGARYEGLVVNFLERLGAFGGSIVDEHGRVRVDEEPAIAALTHMRDSIHRIGSTPPAVLSWQEEQSRLAFQNGQAVFMRNWPYAAALLAQDGQSAVAGRFAIAPLPGTPAGEPTSALGGSALAVNAHSDQPAEARALIDFLLEPEQMVERARVVGQFPPRPSTYDDPALAGALGLPPADVLRIVETARPRPVTPVYSQLSAILQVALHGVLTRQDGPRPALERAAAEMRALLARVGLGPA
jgi:multiple sugar transport system substrate-binding protein